MSGGWGCPGDCLEVQLLGLVITRPSNWTHKCYELDFNQINDIKVKTGTCDPTKRELNN